MLMLLVGARLFAFVHSHSGRFHTVVGRCTVHCVDLLVVCWISFVYRYSVVSMLMHVTCV